MSGSFPTGTARAVAFAGLVAGTLDGLAACIQYYIATGKDPSRVFLFIASGAFGKDAYENGMYMVFAGIAFHYVFATGWSTLYFFLYPRIRLLRERAILSGALYGLVVWAGMNLIVIPLSKIASGPFDAMRALQASAILVVCVGIPIALIAHRSWKP